MSRTEKNKTQQNIIHFFSLDIRHSHIRKIVCLYNEMIIIIIMHSGCVRVCLSWAVCARVFVCLIFYYRFVELNPSRVRLWSFDIILFFVRSEKCVYHIAIWVRGKYTLIAAEKITKMNAIAHEKMCKWDENDYILTDWERNEKKQKPLDEFCMRALVWVRAFQCLFPPKAFARNMYTHLFVATQ